MKAKLKKPKEKVYDLQKIRRDLNDLHKCGQVNTSCIGSRSLLWRALLEILPVTSDTEEWKDKTALQRSYYISLFNEHLSDSGQPYEPLDSEQEDPLPDQQELHTNPLSFLKKSDISKKK